MKLLLLGGPKFVGRAFTDAALARGHELTFFNRGRTNADLYPDVERLVGDREGDLSSLAGREWDAVVDTSGYVPHVVASSATALSEQRQLPLRIERFGIRRHECSGGRG